MKYAWGISGLVAGIIFLTNGNTNLLILSFGSMIMSTLWWMKGEK